MTIAFDQERNIHSQGTLVGLGNAFVLLSMCRHNTRASTERSIASLPTVRQIGVAIAYMGLSPRPDS